MSWTSHCDHVATLDSYFILHLNYLPRSRLFLLRLHKSGCFLHDSTSAMTTKLITREKYVLIVLRICYVMPILENKVEYVYEIYYLA